MNLYLLLKFVHVVLAIIAVGSNTTYGIWLGRARSVPAHLPYVLKGIKFIDDRMANPSYILLLLTGLALAALGNISLLTFWVAGGIVLLVVVGVLGFAVYTPTLRNEIAAVEAGRGDSNEFRRLDTRATIVGITLGVLTLAIVFLMVTKPRL